MGFLSRLKNKLDELKNKLDEKVEDFEEKHLINVPFLGHTSEEVNKIAEKRREEHKKEVEPQRIETKKQLYVETKTEPSGKTTVTTYSASGLDYGQIIDQQTFEKPTTITIETPEKKVTLGRSGEKEGTMIETKEVSYVVPEEYVHEKTGEVLWEQKFKDKPVARFGAAVATLYSKHSKEMLGALVRGDKKGVMEAINKRLGEAYYTKSDTKTQIIEGLSQTFQSIPGQATMTYTSMFALGTVTRVPQIAKVMDSRATKILGLGLLGSYIVGEALKTHEYWRLNEKNKAIGTMMQTATNIVAMGSGFVEGMKYGTLKIEIPLRARALMNRGLISEKEYSIIMSARDKALKGVPKTTKFLTSPERIRMAVDRLTQRRVLSVIREHNYELFGSLAQESQIKPEIRRTPIDFDIAFKNKEGLSKLRTAAQGKVKLDLHAEKELKQFLFYERPIRSPTLERIMSAREQLYRKLVGSVDEVRLQRKGKKEIFDVYRLVKTFDERAIKMQYRPRLRITGESYEYSYYPKRYRRFGYIGYSGMPSSSYVVMSRIVGYSPIRYSKISFSRITSRIKSSPAISISRIVPHRPNPSYTSSAISTSGYTPTTYYPTPYYAPARTTIPSKITKMKPIPIKIPRMPKASEKYKQLLKKPKTQYYYAPDVYGWMMNIKAPTWYKKSLIATGLEVRGV